MSRPMRGRAVLEIHVDATNDVDGRYRRSDINLMVDGKPVSTSPTQDQQIWNALPRAIRDLLLACCEEAAEPDDDDALPDEPPDSEATIRGDRLYDEQKDDELMREREEILDERSSSDVYAGVE